MNRSWADPVPLAVVVDEMVTGRGAPGDDASAGLGRQWSTSFSKKKRFRAAWAGALCLAWSMLMLPWVIAVGFCTSIVGDDTGDGTGVDIGRVGLDMPYIY